MKDEEKRNLKVVPEAPSQPAACSFCGKRKDETRALIAGDAGFICAECVAKAAQALSRP